MIARALEKGADDYIVKPFSLTELMVMIQAALRRRQAPSPAQPTEPYVRGDLTIDYAERLVRVAGRPVADRRQLYLPVCVNYSCRLASC